MTKTLFISDLHLQASEKKTTDTFLHWLNTEAPGSDAIYILGDLFEVWIGDDDNSAFNQQIMQALRAVSDTGIPLFYIHGNRDFLIGEQFAKATGITLLPEHIVIDLYGTPTLIMHGDTLCTLDTYYQRFRERVRTPKFTQYALSKPLWFRRLIAKLYRLQSRFSVSQKSAMIMDVAPDTVRKMMESYHVQHLIHGHTHRPAVHHLIVKDKSATRTVLGSWEHRANMLVCTPDEQKLVFFD
jgi:UDP-2,3-diacylglucosamine hydrolase